MAKEVTPEQIEMLDGMVAKARAAAEIIATYDQERVDRLGRGGRRFCDRHEGLGEPG